MTQLSTGRRPSEPPAILPPSGLGGPVPWMIAVVTALAILGLAAAIALTPAANALSGQIAGRATIQLIDIDPILRREHVRAVREMLRDATYVAAARTVPEAELQAMAAQWLGEGVRETGIPLPALIDVDLLETQRGPGLTRLRADVAAIVPTARVIAHADWLGPVAGLMRSVGTLAALGAALLVVIAAAVSVIAARAALASHSATIDVLNLVGATDLQITRLFQRQIARDTVIGAGIGAGAGLAIFAVIGWQMWLVMASLASGDGWLMYLWILAIPLMVVAIAILAARIAVLRMLRVMT